MKMKLAKIYKITNEFELAYYEDDISSQLVVRSLGKGKHFASHSRFNLMDDKGNLIKNMQIDKEVAQFIINNFEERGHTASFEVYKSDLEIGQITRKNVPVISPSDVRHSITNAEKSFTATGDKLNFHWPIFEKYKNTGYGSIIRATLTLHQVCSSHCHYCSTIARNKKDSISLDEAKNFVNALYNDQAEYNKNNFKEYNDKYKELTGTDIRLKSLILSGGGQPNLWPHFEEFVEWLSTKDIDLGLITNGFPKKINESVYENFDWVRISITPEDCSPHYPDNKFDKQYLPSTIIDNKTITVGYSYVYGPWTDDEILNRIDMSITQNNFDYCRLLTDCNLSKSAQLKAHQGLAERLFTLGYIDKNGVPLKKLFHQLKYHGDNSRALKLWDDGQCQLQIYNVFWDTTGHDDKGWSHCYACDSVTVLAEEKSDHSISVSERKFNSEKWGLVSNRDVKILYEEPVKPYFDPREICSACLFMKNNETVKNLVNTEDYHKIIISSEIKHINFV